MYQQDEQQMPEEQNNNQMQEQEQIPEQENTGNENNEANKGKKLHTPEEVSAIVQKRVNKERKDKEALAAENAALKELSLQKDDLLKKAQANQISPEDFQQAMHYVNKAADQKAAEQYNMMTQKQNNEALGVKLENACKEDPEFAQLIQEAEKTPDDHRVFNALAQMNYIPNIAAVAKQLLSDQSDLDIARAASPFELKKYIKEVSDKLAVKKPGPNQYNVEPVIKGSNQTYGFDNKSYLKEKGLI